MFISLFLPPCLESAGKNKDNLDAASSNKKSNGTGRRRMSLPRCAQERLYLASSKPTPSAQVVSVLKSDTISVLKPDDRLDDFFADTNKNLSNEPSVQLNADDLNRIAENAVR
jgi:hypothetical protein